jgi:S1/P1 Nuclease
MNTKRLVTFSLVVALMIGYVPRPAYAWNKPGHMVVAAIAYRELQRTGNQAVIDKVVGKLKVHPDFNKRFGPKLVNVASEDRDLYLFMLAARWSDDIRDVQHSDDDKPAHFIDNPFVPPGLTGVATAPIAADNLVSKFTSQLAIAKDGSQGDDARSKALTWLMHLSGDSHQPLHAASMFTHDFKPPEGDRGGNEIFVKVSAESHTINLHAFWDGLILGSDRFQSVRSRALGLIGRPDMKRDTFPQLSSLEVGDWINESFEFARVVAYQDGAIQGSGDKEDGDVLPDHYPSTCKGIAERQAILAGYRLADLLKTLAPSL